MADFNFGQPAQSFAQSSDTGRFPNPIPRLDPPFQDTSMRDTPNISADIDAHLHITESTSEEDDDEEDSIEDEDSSASGDSDDELVQKTRGLSIAELPTGLCYDERMRYHAEISATTGENVHPEDPRRIYYIYKELCEAGLVADPHFKKHDLIVKTPLLRIDAREATKEECCLVHTNNHYEFVKHTAGMPLSELVKLNNCLADGSRFAPHADLSDEALIDLSEDIHMDSIYFNSLSYFSAKLSAGAAIETCKAVVSRRVKNAIAVIRPPGHHAEMQSTMGFCLFNNVCVASRVCQEDFWSGMSQDSDIGLGCSSWSVQAPGTWKTLTAAGNGCQKAFYTNPNILYISIHVHMDGRFYPSGNDGGMDKVGVGAGEGKNVNIPWPTKGMGDGDYMFAFQQVVMPIALEFNPDLVIVAAGFDAAAGDELGGCFVSPACYAHMTHMLMALANGKVAVCLEGGYNFGAISKSALAVTRTLMGEPPDRLTATQATEIAMTTVQQVKEIQSRYWGNIIPKGPPGGPLKGDRLHDTIRQQQATYLYENFKMTELHILRDTISKSFHNQVLASRNYQDKDYLLVVFHDAPEVSPSGGGITTLQRPHDSILLDASREYVADAIRQGFGVIDVNIPEYITLPMSVTSGLGPDEANKAHTYENAAGNGLDIPYGGTLDLARQDSTRLAKYLWENYIEPYNFPAESIILMGCGQAFHAVARLMSDLPGEAVYQSPIRERENAAGNSFGGTTTGMLAGVVGFISRDPVRPVHNSVNPWVGEWYRKNSLVFVAEGHVIFRQGKKSKKYGNLRSVEDGLLSQIMERDQVRSEAWSFMLDRVGKAVGDSTEEEDEQQEQIKREVKQEARSENGVEVVRVDGSSGVPADETTFLVDDVVMSTER